MSNRKIINAAATGGIGYYPVVGASDPYYDKVSLLLNGDNDVDTNFANVSLLLTGNDLLDKSNNKATVTTYGNAAVTSINKKFGTGSYYFDGSGDYLRVSNSSNFAFGTGDFTIECWVYLLSSKNHTIFDTRDSTTGADGMGIVFLFDASNKLWLYSGSISPSSSNSTSLNSWTHVAVCRASGTIKTFINGVSGYSATFTNNLIGTGGLTGTIFDVPTNASYQSNLYLDDLRITKGIARYTANFTPPTQALPSHEILDSSVYRLPVTTYGNARIDTATKKYGTGAMYFDGSGDYCTLPASSNTLLNGVDFTIECWIRPTRAAGSGAGAGSGLIQPIMVQGNGWWTGGLQGNFLFIITNAGISISAISSGAVGLTTSFTPSLTSWQHIAVTRIGTTMYAYADGLLIGTQTGCTDFGSSTTWANTVGLGYFGDTQVANYFQGYIDDLRITKGYARYTANFTPPTAAFPTIPPTIAADPWWGNVSLLLDGNTTDAYDPYWQNVSLMLTGDDFIDWSNQHGVVTTSGSTTLISSDTKYRTSAIQFNGTGTTYLSIPSSTALNMTGDFTMEYWAKFTNLSTNPVVLSKWANGNFSYHIGCDITVGNGFFFIYSTTGGGGGNVFIFSGVAPVLNTWTHYAVSVSGTTLRMFVNGSLVKTTTISAIYAGTEKLTIGNNQDPGYSTNSYMILSDIRITKGVARYTANFTPPIAALPAFKIQDRTQNNLTLTPYGNVQLSTDVKKNGTGSMFFDGTGDYVNLSPSSNLNFGTGDFTVEGWMYKINNSTDQAIVTLQGSTSNFYVPVFYGGSGGVGTDKLAVQSGSSVITSSSTAFPLNQWVHFAIIRSSGTITIYQNGVSVGSAAGASDYIGTLNYAYVGAHYNGGTTYYPYLGYIDDLRITKGYARYTQNFTPPSQSFANQYISTGFDPNYADVSLLLTGEGTNGSTTFTDLSSSPKTITNSNSVTTSTTAKKYGTGSIAFSGSNYLTISNSTYLAFPNEFTIEFWAYCSAAPSYSVFLGITGGVQIGLDVNGYLAIALQGVTFQLNSTTTLPLNTWNHIAVSRNTANIVNIYLNGISVVSGTIATSYSAGDGYINYNLASTGSKFTGYIDDLRITKGIARYTTNFTPPTYALATTTGTAFDVNRVDTSLLLRGNGTNGSTSFTDESPNNLTVTNTGSVTVNTTTKKYGTGSMAFGGSNYLSVPCNSIFDFGTGDFTLEAWVYATVSTVQGLFDTRSGQTATNYIWNFESGPKLNLYLAGTYCKTTNNIPTNQWVHIATVRNSGIIKHYVNGIVDNATGFSQSGIINTNNTTALIGRLWDASGLYLNGYIDDLRITKGYARYTSNFTPPTYEDPIVTGTVYDYNYPQVSLLLNGDGTNGSTVFKDLSSSPKTVTAYGNAQISTAQKKFGTGSMYFDGSGDYLSVPYSTNLLLNSVNSTLEGWFYLNASPGGPGSTAPFFCQTDITNSSTSGGSNFWCFADGTYIYFGGGGQSTYLTAAVSNLPINQWFHLAVVITAGVSATVYINGVSKMSGTIDAIGSNSAYSTFIGACKTGVPPGTLNSLNGYADDLRITKGVARYTQNFTPPTAPLPTSYS
jgi:hypothetical protein